MNFEDKVVIITGASNGLGKGITHKYAELGAKVVLADIDETSGRKAVQEMEASGAKALFIKTDVRKEEDIIHLMKLTVSHFDRIDILINNAGKTIFTSPYELSVEDWDDIIQTNLRSVFLCSREAAKYMKKNKNGGRIVNMASTRAVMSEPYSEVYAASKGGIVSITHALAASLSEDKITVNAISPGWIETGDYAELREKDHAQHLSKRVGKPSDIAKACMYLTDSGNEFVTGINLTVDGGMTSKMIYEE